MPQELKTDLLSDFTKINVDRLRQINARLPFLSSEAWSQLAIVCEFLARLATAYRDGVYAVLNRGIEAHTLKVPLKQSMAFIDDAVEAMSELQQPVSERFPADVPIHLDRIRNANAETKAVHADLASLLTLAEVEPPPVSEDILAAAEAGPFIRLDEFRKRA
jgi:hypothetical protein